MEALQSREVPRLHLVFHVQFTGKSAYTDGRAQLGKVLTRNPT